MTKYAIVINNKIQNVIVAANLEIAKKVTKQENVIEIPNDSLVGIDDSYTPETGFVLNREVGELSTPEKRQKLLESQPNNE